MLMGFSGHLGSQYTARDTIHNYYEKLVIEQLVRSNDRAGQDPDFLADVTCVALNRLPPRYIRHDVDMTFFLSPTEMDEMADKVVRAVNDAVAYVENREQQKNLEEEAFAQQKQTPPPKKSRSSKQKANKN